MSGGLSLAPLDPPQLLAVLRACTLPWIFEPGRHPKLDADDVLQANEAFYSAFNQKDAAAMDALWARSVMVGCVHPGWNVLLGREPVIESWERILGNPTQLKIFSGGANVSVIGEVAIVACSEMVGGSPLAATNVFVREDGSWKLAHHHSGPVSLGG
ncbi:MAG: DUF4440 domain-containing protein [Chloroflexi bacterium]|nr:DUF4440 domain-containing protein [Chloroflexota bacterium]